jgi:branched-chain amino acid transport system ATP-binding protein
LALFVRSAEGGIVLELTGVTKRLGGTLAVDDVSFRLRPGSITGLIGPNGAGKTTLFNTIAGQWAPSAGSIRFAGHEIAGRAPYAIFRRGIARTFQIPRPFPEMSVLENLMLVGSAQPGERFWNTWLRPSSVAAHEHALRARALEALDFLGLTHLAGSKAQTLSGGQLKLLELGRAFMAAPQILLLDEPAAGVNPALMDGIVERIRALNARGMTIFLIEHNMPLVMSLCDPILVMANGRLLLEGSAAAVQSDARVVEAYLGGDDGARG